MSLWESEEEEQEEDHQHQAEEDHREEALPLPQLALPRSNQSLQRPM